MNETDKSTTSRKFKWGWALRAVVPGACMFGAMNSLIGALGEHHASVVFPIIEVAVAVFLPWAAFYYLIGILRSGSSR